jgi:acyl dehydratase
MGGPVMRAQQAPTPVAGAEIPGLEIGPLSLTDFVRWAGYQENWIRLHYDRAYALEYMDQSDVVQSGNHRTALLVRMITSWVGPSGWVRRLSVRHTGLIRPGDTVRCAGCIRDVRTTQDGARTVEAEIWAVRQDGEQVSAGVALVEITR